MAPMEILASVLHGAKDLRLETRTIEEPSANEVQVAVKATGLCGSDMHYFTHARNGDIIMQEPLVLGHESSGIVTAVGSEVTHLDIGDRVAIECGVACGECEYCLSGRYNLCSKMRFRSSAKSFPHFQGTLQERLNHPARSCWKLPEEISFDQAALIEPLSVAVHALNRAKMAENEHAAALVFGAGAVGALTAAALRLNYNKVQVTIADVDEGRVSFATANRFAHDGVVIPMKRGSTIEERLAIAKENADLVKDRAKHGYDLVFECTGQETCLQSSIHAARTGGKVLIVGMGQPVQNLPISAAALREVDLIGVFRYAHTYPRCIELLQFAEQEIKAGKDLPNINKLITHRVQGLSNAPKAFELASKPVDSDGQMVLKIFIEG